MTRAATENNISSKGLHNVEFNLREEDNLRKNLSKIKEWWKEKKRKSCKKLSKIKEWWKDHEDVTENRWRDLHPPILELILKGLSLTDRRRLGLVCSSWNAVEKQCLYPPVGETPWLVLHGINPITRGMTFYSLFESRMYHIDLPQLLGKFFTTASRGWLLISHSFQDVVDRILINPVSKEQIEVPNLVIGCWNFLSVPETTDQESTLLLSSPSRRFLVFRRGNDHRWMEQTSENGSVCPFISCKGKLYGLQNMYKIVVIDLAHEPKEWLLDMDCSKVPSWACWYYISLVESCGEVLLVLVIMAPHNNKLYSFRVFKADFDAMTWVKVESLGDQILFMADSHCLFSCPASFSFSASELRTKGNKIYFLPREASDETKNGYWIEFNLERRRVTKCSVPGYQGPISAWM